MRFMRKIGFKLIVAAGFTAIVIIGVFSYFNIRSHSKGLLAEVERHANQLSETVKYSTRYDMLLNQRDRISLVIRNIGEQPSIDRIRVMNKSGEIMYSSRDNDIGKMLDKNAESCYACHAADQPLQKLSIPERTRVYRMNEDSSRLMGIINPIYNERSCWEAACHEHAREQTVLGVLDVTMSLEDADRQIKQGELEMVIFAICAFLVISIMLWVFVRKWVVVPVRDLVKATHEVASGNLSYTIKEAEADELGQLARSFNAMTHKLSDARLQLFQSDKMASLGRLAAGVAHEINNPLTGVLTYSSFLLKRTAHQPELQKDLAVIVRETLRSREIVKSLLDFARQSVPKKNESDIHDVIERALTVVDNQITLNHVRLEKDFDTSNPNITIDANQIQQVVINLLVNGADAIGPKGGVIRIATSRVTLSPKGTMQIKRAVCPKRHNLISNDNKIGGLPTIHFIAKHASGELNFHMYPIYGHPKSPDRDLSTVMCPQCRTSLMADDHICPQCGGPTFHFEVPGLGMVESCTRKACNFQKWESVDSAGPREFVEIRIDDSGCGIPQEDLPRIFEPFYTTKGQQGTGLGLAVIWGIVDNHDGTITVSSEVQKGTSFTIRLPVKL